MLNGLKLLLADDSVAIQKVIDLTFTDEGMQVTTVGDGQKALERLAEVAPDIVLADCFMPGIDGYELCRIIRSTERFKQIPVILLTGSFEPFNEAEARRAGANDVVTKPFQSIRQLISKVGSLLGSQTVNGAPAHEYSTLGLGRTDDLEPATADSAPIIDPNVKVMVEAAAPEPESMQDANVTVLVEAASMPEHELSESSGPHCETDVAVQTADTMQLEPVSDEKVGARTLPASYSHDDTIEIEPVKEVSSSPVDSGTVLETDSSETVNATRTAAPSDESDMFGDTILDFGLFNDSPSSSPLTEDMVLDLDLEEPGRPPAPVADENVQPVAAFSDAHPATEVVTAESLVDTAAAAAQAHDWTIVPGTPAEKAAPSAPSQKGEEATTPAASVNLNELSPEMIDAIARRAVEQLSEKVVREIAWEVVPELAELLIKERLDQEK